MSVSLAPLVWLNVGSAYLEVYFEIHCEIFCDQERQVTFSRD